jgi:hypothetical protein
MMKINVFVLFLTLLSIVAFTGTLFAQASLPVYESFNYAAGNLVGNAGWSQTGNPPTTANPVQVVDTSLTYTGLPDSAGRKVSLLNGTNYEDPGFDITPTGSQSEASSVFVSCILNVVNPGLPAGEYFLHVCTAGMTSIDFHSRVFVRQGAGGAGFFNMGIRNYSADTIQFETTERAVATPIFVVVSYDFVTGGTGNDTSRLWVNPTLGAGTAPAPLLTATATGVDLAAVGRINLRQPSANTGQSLEVDEIRAGTTWTSVTPAKSGVDDWAVF